MNRPKRTRKQGPPRRRPCDYAAAPAGVLAATVDIDTADYGTARQLDELTMAGGTIDVTPGHEITVTVRHVVTRRQLAELCPAAMRLIDAPAGPPAPATDGPPAEPDAE